MPWLGVEPKTPIPISALSAVTPKLGEWLQQIPRTNSRERCIEECSPRNPAGAEGDNIELCLPFVKVSVMSTRVLHSTKSSASGFHLFIFGLNNSVIL